MTDQEADAIVAREVRKLINAHESSLWWSIQRDHSSAEWNDQLSPALNRVAKWLMRRECMGDKILTRQIEAPLGRQVKPTRKQARALGLPDPKGGK